MDNLDEIKDDVLRELISDFRSRKLSFENLESGYEGIPLSALKSAHEESSVNFELALKELEDAELVDTGPMLAHENDRDSPIVLIGVYSAREYTFLTERGYKAALKLGKAKSTKRKKANPATDAPHHFYGIHPAIIEKCADLYEGAAYAEAVEKSFKIVRGRLRELTGYETGAEAFGKGKLYISGAATEFVDKDFNEAVKFLAMAVDKFRNEKAHSIDGNISDPIRAHQYLSLSSLALYLLENATIPK
jgi:uncharacterized protein (TIGR02391 family)